jgi:hypothetical protein
MGAGILHSLPDLKPLAEMCSQNKQSIALMIMKPALDDV